LQDKLQWDIIQSERQSKQVSKKIYAQCLQNESLDIDASNN